MAKAAFRFVNGDAAATDISGVTIDVCETLAAGTPVSIAAATLRQGAALGATPSKTFVLDIPAVTERTIVQGHDNENPYAEFYAHLDPVDGDIAQASLLLAYYTTLAAALAGIPAAVTALGGIGGIITAVVDAGVTVSSSFNPIRMEKGEKKVISYQILENGTAVDVSAYTFVLGVKKDIYDTAYAFAAIDGVVSADDDGVDSIVTFTIPAASTKALTRFVGRYSVGMYDGSGNKAALTAPGGVEFQLTEDVLDVA